jgi:hypothetical protein
MKESEISNDEILSFKILPSEYADSTIKGNIYLSCADFYAYQHETSGNMGQGDKDEGLFARVFKNNIEYIKEQRSRHKSDLLENEHGKFVDLKLKSVINIPVYCFYSVNATSPNVTHEDRLFEKSGVYHRSYKVLIPKRVLQDFSNSGTFSVLSFLNHSELSKLIMIAAQKEGSTRMLRDRIHYVDRKDKEWFCPIDQHPGELFFKDIAFNYQSEGRIVLDDGFDFVGYAEVLKKFHPLNIGDLTRKVTKQPIADNSDIHVIIM